MHDNAESETRVSGLTPQLVAGTIGTRSDWGLNWTSQAVTMELDQAKVVGAWIVGHEYSK